MWCLETINEINQNLAVGKDLVQAYESCGILKIDQEMSEVPEICRESDEE